MGMASRATHHNLKAIAGLRILTGLAFAITLMIIGCNNPDKPIRATDEPLSTSRLQCEDARPFPGYQALMADPATYGHQCIWVEGTVFQTYTTEFGRSVAFIDTDPQTPSGPVFVYGTEECFKDNGRVVEGQQINLKVRMADKLYGYGAAGGGWNEVPIGVCGRVAIPAPSERTNAKEECRSVSDQAVREWSDWHDIRFVSETKTETGYRHRYQAYHGGLPISTHTVHMDNKCKYPSTKSIYP